MHYNEIANHRLYQGDSNHGEYTTILNQLTAIFSRHDFEYLAKVHHNGQKFRSYNRWSQSLTMITAQVAGLKSLRGIRDTFQSQGKRIYNLEMKNITGNNYMKFIKQCFTACSKSAVKLPQNIASSSVARCYHYRSLSCCICIKSAGRLHCFSNGLSTI